MNKNRKIGNTDKNSENFLLSHLSNSLVFKNHKICQHVIEKEKHIVESI